MVAPVVPGVIAPGAVAQVPVAMVPWLMAVAPLGMSVVPAVEVARLRAMPVMPP
jgi:hypothetical protein